MTFCVSGLRQELFSTRLQTLSVATTTPCARLGQPGCESSAFTSLAASLPSFSASRSWPPPAASVGLQREPQLLLPLHDVLVLDVQPGICNLVSPCDCLHRASATPTPITCAATRKRMGASMMATAA